MKVGTIPQSELGEMVPLIAQLRIDVFRDWPYLYDGDVENDVEYLLDYIDSPNAAVIGAWDGTRLVGASTAVPLEDHAEASGAAFAEHGYALKDIYYCAESVLLPKYRGQGLGHAFFDHREAAARRLGRKWCCFCSVIRSEDHPARPENYRPLDDFWRKRGYAPMDGVVAEFSWRDIGETDQTTKSLQFWIRETP